MLGSARREFVGLPRRHPTGELYTAMGRRGGRGGLEGGGAGGGVL